MSSNNQELDLSNISEQLDSDNSRDRLRALVSLRDLSPDDAVSIGKYKSYKFNKLNHSLGLISGIINPRRA